MERLISENGQEYLMGKSHSEYRPIPMSARQVLQSYALLRTARFDARRAAYCMAVWWTWMVSRFVTVLIAYFYIASVVEGKKPKLE